MGWFTVIASIYWLVVAVLAAFFVAWNNGSNNAANMIGTVVGSRALSLKKALVLASIFEFIGALLFGRFVSLTLMRGIVDITQIKNVHLIIVGMISVLIATGLWVLIASILRVPMSISGNIVGGIIGVAIVSVGLENINWSTLSFIAAAWGYLPAVSAALAFALYKIYGKALQSEKSLPYVLITSVFIMVFSTSLLLLISVSSISNVVYSVYMSLAIAVLSIPLVIVFDKLYLSKFRDVPKKELYIKLLLLASASAMAFSHGAHDVANSAGPLSAVILALTSPSGLPPVINVSGVALVIAAMGMSIGIIMWGSRVVEVIGAGITILTYTSAYCAQLATSIAVLVITRLGLPVSTTIAVVGSIAGVGLARGIKAINVKTIIKIVVMWAAGLPAVMTTSALLYMLFIKLTL